MKTPLSNRPKITDAAIAAGSVTRYFVKHVSTKKVTEVDETQYSYFSGHPYFQAISFRWVIGGNDKNTTSQGVVVYGAGHRNAEIIKYYNQKMPGINLLLKNPLEYFSGKYIRVESLFVNIVEPIVVVPPVEEIEYGLSRATLGRIGAHSDAPIDNVTTAFVLADWTLVTNLTRQLVSGRLRLTIASAGAGTTRASYYAPAGDLADIYMQSNWAAEGSCAFHRAGLYGRGTTEATPNDMIFGRIPVRDSGTATLDLVERVASATVQTDTSNTNLTIPQRLSLMIRGSTANSFSHGPSIERTLSGIGLSAAGKSGIILSNDCGSTSSTDDFDEFYAMTSELIRVEGSITLPWKAVLADAGGTTLAEATASEGVALIDCYAARVIFPLGTTLKIVNTQDDSVITTATPIERVWGGDIWNITQD